MAENRTVSGHILGADRQEVGFSDSAPLAWGACWLVLAAARWATHPSAALECSIIACGSELRDAVLDIGTDPDDFFDRGDRPRIEGPGLWRVPLVNLSDPSEYRFAALTAVRLTAAEAGQLFQLGTEGFDQ